MSRAMEQWATREEVIAARERLEAAHPGRQRPAAFGVGLARGGETVFSLVNEAGSHLSAVVPARLVGHRRGTATHPVSTDLLEEAVAGQAPAEACTDYDHPDLHH